MAVNKLPVNGAHNVGVPVAGLDMHAEAVALAEQGFHLVPVYLPNPDVASRVDEKGKRVGGCSCPEGPKGGSNCISPGKHPMTRYGVKDADHNPKRVDLWWSGMYRGANIGIATGKRLPDGRYLVVLDIDGEQGEASLAELVAAHGALPATRTVATGSGGRHLYFGTDNPIPKRKPLPGLDLQGAAVYVVAPPSLHASGQRYAWEDPTAAIAPLPGWLHPEGDSVQPTLKVVPRALPVQQQPPVGPAPQPLTAADEALVARIQEAGNADKFTSLYYEGDVSHYGNDQSAADHALLEILCFYNRDTGDDEQVRRVFRASVLGQRDKALRDDYLNRSIAKFRREQAAKSAAARVVYEQFNPTTPAATVATEPVATVGALSKPPGLVGELTDYIYSSSGRPVLEVSLCAALALVAGITGRQYNTPTGSGLNLYLVLLGRTGIGKEGADSGINRVLAEVGKKVPLVEETFMGPRKFSSGPAAIRKMSKQPCMLTIQPEFGITVQRLTDPHADGNGEALRQVLLDLYNKSGRDGVLRASAYADSANDTAVVSSPALTLLGEGTPDSFYEGLSQEHIGTGLIPRLLVVEYQGQRPKRNREAGAPPPAELVQRVEELATAVLNMAGRNDVVQVQHNAEAEAMLDAFDEECDQRINDPHADGATEEIWNRAHLKALRVAGLLAVGVNHHNPTVTAEEAAWAIGLVRQDVGRLLKRFATGDVGRGDEKQLADLRRLLERYPALTAKQLQAYRASEGMQAKRVVPYRYLQSATGNLASFKADRRGATGALNAALQTMVDRDELQGVPKEQLKQDFGIEAKAYHWRG